MARNLARCASAFAAIEQRDGRALRAGARARARLPAGDGGGDGAFLERWLFDEGAWTTVPERVLRRHLGVCVDLCHLAVVGEDPLAALADLRTRAASRCRRSRSRRASNCAMPEALDRLLAFAEPRYLHQTRRCPDQNGAERALDLPDVRAAPRRVRAAPTPASCVRTTTCRCSGTSRARSARRSARSNACCAHLGRRSGAAAAARGRDLHLERARRLRRARAAARACSANSTRSPPGSRVLTGSVVFRRSSSHPMIHLRSVQKSYRAANSACSRVPSIASTSPAGEQVALIGRSGTGKTTLLHILAGILRPDRARSRSPAQRLDTMGETARDRHRGQHIGMVYQTFNLLQPFTALENVLLGALFGRGAGAEAKLRAESLLSRSASATACTIVRASCRSGRCSASRSAARWSTIPS
jgi:hypothetical protein